MKPTLCLLHAFPLDAEMFAEQRANLADVADLITPNLPGFGSTPPLAPATLDGMARAIAQSLPDDRPIILGGVSMGGYVALAFARLFPGRLAGLILCDTRAEPDDENARAGRDTNITRVREQGLGPLVEGMLPKLLGETTRREHPGLVERVRRLALNQNSEGVIAGLQALRDRIDARPHLAQIRVPTLLVYGAEDVLTPPRTGESLALILRGKLVVIPGAGHLPNLEAPTEFNQAVREFLR